MNLFLYGWQKLDKRTFNNHFNVLMSVASFIVFETIAVMLFKD